MDNNTIISLINNTPYLLFAILIVIGILKFAALITIFSISNKLSQMARQQDEMLYQKDKMLKQQNVLIEQNEVLIQQNGKIIDQLSYISNAIYLFAKEKSSDAENSK